MTNILALPILIDQPDRQEKSLVNLLPKLSEGAGYLSVKRSVNNELRFTFNRRLPGRKVGENLENRQLEQKAKQLENQFYKLSLELIDKKYQLLSSRRKYETTGDKLDWDKIAGLELEIRDIARSLYGEHSERFKSVSDSILGITNDLQEIIESSVSRLSGSGPSLNKINFYATIQINKFLLDRLNQSSKKIDWAKGNKLTKLGPKARHRFLETGAILENHCGNSSIIFSTFTCPGRSDEIKKVLADYSSYIINNLLQTFRDYTKKTDTYINFCFAWEPHQDGCLHLHLIWGSPGLPDSEINYLSEKLGKKWEKILDKFSTNKYVSKGNKAGCLPGIDMYARNYNDIHHKNRQSYKNILTWANHKKQLWELGRFVVHEKVNKSAAAYLSKYASKENYKLNKGVNLYFPSRWWGADQQSQILAKSERFEVTIPIDDQVYDLISSFLEVAQDSIKYFHKKTWDIYSIISNNGKSQRVNRKPWEARPANSLRVSSGSHLIMYFQKNKFEAVSEIIYYICGLLREKNLKNNQVVSGKKHLNIDEIANIYDRNFSPGINQKIAINHKIYWQKILFS